MNATRRRHGVLSRVLCRAGGVKQRKEKEGEGGGVGVGGRGETGGRGRGGREGYVTKRLPAKSNSHSGSCISSSIPCDGIV
jgi:hypothetical protein